MRNPYLPALVLSAVVISHLSLPAQCPITVNAGDDIYLCAPTEPVELQGSIDGPYVDFKWTPLTGLTDANTLTPTVKVNQTTNYVLRARAISTEPNLVVNGNFTDGNTGFSSDYLYSPGDLSMDGTYDVGANIPAPVAIFGCTDHSGDGSLLVAHSDLIAGDNTWCQSVAVAPNTDYYFSAWALAFNFYHTIGIKVNGTIIASYIYTPITDFCHWYNVAGIWNSGNNTTANLCIGRLEGYHHYYALDEISFTKICESMDTVKVHVNTITANVSPVAATIPCNGYPISLNGGGSTTGPDIVYTWGTNDGHIVSGETTLTPVIDAAGTYTLTVTQPNGLGDCTKTATVTIQENPMQAWINPPEALDCTTSSTQLIGNSTQAGPKSYQWTATDGGNISAGANQPVATVNQPGEYHLLVTNTNTGCTAEASVNVAGTSVPVAHAQAPLFQCTAHSRINLSGAGSSSGPGYAQHWSTPNGHIVSGQDSLFAVADTPGIYILLVTNTLNDCSRADTVVIGIDTVPLSAAIVRTGILDCITDTLLLSANTSPANALIKWAFSAGGNISGRTDTTFAWATAPGVYTLTASNPATGCSATAVDTLLQNTMPPVATIEPVGPLTCQEPSRTLSAQGSSAGPEFTYTWTAANGGSIVGDIHAPAVSAESSGFYNLLIVNNLNNCSSTASIVVEADTGIVNAVVQPPAPLNCLETQRVIDASASTAGPTVGYHWSTADGLLISGADSPTPVAAAAGEYTLLVTNSGNGCTAVQSVWLEQDTASPNLHIAPAGPITCGTPVRSLLGQNLSIPGNFSYQWTATGGGHILSGEQSLQLLVDAPGTYAFQATNADNGCTAVVSVQVGVDVTPPAADLTVGGVLNCNTPSVELTAPSSSGAFALEYYWALPGGTFVSTGVSPVLHATVPGVYALTVSNPGNGCADTGSATVVARVPVEITVDSMRHITCYGDNSGFLEIHATGGAGIFTYSWNIGNQGNTLDHIGAGTYTVTATDGENCTATVSATLAQPAELLVTTSAVPPTTAGGNDGAATASPSGGTGAYSFTWNTGETTASIAGLSQGLYSVTVGDANGCTSVQTVQVGAGNCNLQAGFTSAAPSCHGLANGEATAMPVGGTAPFAFVWSSGGQASSETGLVAGNYFVTITDMNGCQFTGAISLNDPAPLTLSPESVTPATCPGAADGSATVRAEGGTGTLAINWGNGQTGPFAAGLPPGTYQPTVTDTKGCTASAGVSVSAVDPIPPTILAGPVTLPLGPSGSAALTLANLGASVSDNCALASTHIEPEAFDCTQLGVREVSIQATDAAGNTTSKTIPVTVVDTLSPTLECPADVRHCAGEPTVTYLAPVATDNCLSLGGHFDLVSGLPSGAEFPTGITSNTYSFTDASGNVGYCSFHVTVLSPIQIALDTVLPDLGGQQLGGVQVSVSGSQPGYTYTWMSGGQTIALTEDLAGVGMGAYALVVTDAAGCTAQAGPFEVSNLVEAGEAAWMDRIGVFPNPTTGEVFVQLPESAPANDLEVTVFDATGRLVLRQVGRMQPRYRFDLAGFAEGLYSIVLRIDTRLRAWKIALQR